MSLPEDTRELVPGSVFRADDETTHYWRDDGRIHYRHTPVPGADVDSFRFYRGGFAKDRAHGYLVGRRLTGCDGPDLRALNFTYATDGRSVWTLGGVVADADAASFAACDDGFVRTFSGLRVPYGYGKDTRRVVYYDFNGKPTWVRTADAATFVSLNDGYFGKDATTVFCGATAIKRAQLEHWHKLAGHYSRDKRRVFYYQREVRGADPKSFEVVRADHRYQLARDRERCFRNDREITATEFEDLSTR